MEKLTHWKKNIDSRYISGEDLKESLNGLAPEMIVTISKFEDTETFDQKLQAKVTKTGLFFSQLNGKALYKPVILNKTNALFFTIEFNTKYLEKWIGKPVIIFAMADKRHGFVVRFKKYTPPAVSDKNAVKLLDGCKSMDDLVLTWKALSPAEQKLPSVMAKKELLKTTLK